LKCLQNGVKIIVNFKNPQQTINKHVGMADCDQQIKRNLTKNEQKISFARAL